MALLCAIMHLGSRAHVCAYLAEVIFDWYDNDVVYTFQRIMMVCLSILAQ